jgi:hypothetical protein
MATNALLKKLQAIVPVPASPIDVGDVVMKKSMKTLKVGLPQDYLAYARIYGSGTVSCRVYSWEIFSPGRPSFPKFVSEFHDDQGVYRKAMDTFDEVDLGLFPEPGGLLPFGERDDLYFTWKTDSAPDRWKVVVIWRYEKGGFQWFKMGFTEFLIKLLTRKITVDGFKSKWDPKSDISFRPVVYDP